MCGLFGAIGKNISNDKIKILAMLNEKRGPQSTGWIIDDKIKKSILPASSVIRKFHSINKYIIGHTRFATHGTVSIRNCHPFSYGGLSVVHNGVLNNDDELAQCMDMKGHEVDSEVFPNGIASFGNDFFKYVDGYYSIIWTDNLAPTKIFTISHSNKLYYSKNHEKIYFSSESDHLKAIGHSGTAFEEDILYEIDMHTLNFRKTKLDLPKYSGIYNWKTTGDYLEGEYDMANEEDFKYWDGKENVYPLNDKKWNSSSYYNGNGYYNKNKEGLAIYEKD